VKAAAKLVFFIDHLEQVFRGCILTRLENNGSGSQLQLSSNTCCLDKSLQSSNWQQLFCKNSNLLMSRLLCRITCRSASRPKRSSLWARNAPHQLGCTPSYTIACMHACSIVDPRCLFWTQLGNMRLAVWYDRFCSRWLRNNHINSRSSLLIPLEPALISTSFGNKVGCFILELLLSLSYIS